MPRVAKGYIEQLPSGSFRVSVYAGTDPVTRRRIRLKATVKTEQQAHIVLGRVLKEASEGRPAESNAGPGSGGGSSIRREGLCAVHERYTRCPPEVHETALRPGCS
jgi:hypothetical protein